MQKLYLVSRRDLPPGVRACQLAHAGREFTTQHPRLDRSWHKDSNTLVLLEVADEPTLKTLVGEAAAAGAATAPFIEPDMDDQLTAAAILGGETNRLFAQLPLALKRRRCPRCTPRE